MPKIATCLVNNEGIPVRIFKFRKHSFEYPTDRVKEFPYGEAVTCIRLAVFERAGCTPTQPGKCELCGRIIVWQKGFKSSGHLHEKIARGKMVFQGPEGEYSVENSIAICGDCHLGPNGEHGNRRWHTAKKESV